MSTEIIVAIVTGLFSAAGFGFVQFLIARKDRKKAETSSETKALRYIMLYIIQERAKELIQTGEATLEEKRAIHKWHELYHEGLGGNGDADNLMKEVDALKTKFD